MYIHCCYLLLCIPLPLGKRSLSKFNFKLSEESFVNLSLGSYLLVGWGMHIVRSYPIPNEDRLPCMYIMVQALRIREDCMRKWLCL
jgi:hypothetical protein